MRALPGTWLAKCSQGKFSHDSFHCTLLPRNSEASAAMVQDGTALAGTEPVIMHVIMETCYQISKGRLGGRVDKVWQGGGPCRQIVWSSEGEAQAAM